MFESWILNLESDILLIKMHSTKHEPMYKQEQIFMVMIPVKKVPFTHV